MNAYKAILFSAFVGMPLCCAVSDATAAESRGNRCERGFRVGIVDLDMQPDPVVEGQRVRKWLVRLRVEGDRACDTVIELRERQGNDLIAREREHRLRPGVNEIELEPRDRFRFEGKERCFVVLVDIAGTKRPVDSDRRFCARYRPASWTMAEGDEPKRQERERERER
jgi:hypothetical protein